MQKELQLMNYQREILFIPSNYKKLKISNERITNSVLLVFYSNVSFDSLLVFA